jgi:uncharacterized lipoprotein YmbA
MRLAAVILMALGLAACGSSPPVAFYTLDPVPPGDQPRSAYAGPPLQVGNVAVPPMLDREELVTVAGSNRVAISDRHRWAAPLSAMIRRVLTTDLRARLGAASVRSPGEPVSGNSCRIALDIQQFAGEPGGSLILEGDWAAQRGSARVPAGTRASTSKPEQTSRACQPL